MWMYTLLPKILNMSLTASIVIVTVLLARALLKKAPKVFSYALWAVVLFRLLCPVSFSANFSLLEIFNAPPAINGAIAYIPADIVHTEYPQVNLPFTAISKTINNSLPQGEEQLVADPLEGLVSMATLLWIFGMAAMLIYGMASLVRLRRRLIGAVCLRDNIYLADHAPAPFVIGIFRPKIYLPSTILEQEQGFIILHEQAHIRRLDHIARIVAFLALAVHWFNPFVWVAFLCAVKDMEMSCDEHVLKQMGFDIKGAYSASLLSFAAGRGRQPISGSPLAFGEGSIKERIKNVMYCKRPAAWVVVVSILLIAALSIGFALNRADRKILTAQAALEVFSAENIGGQVIFVIPKDYDMPQKWNIIVAGRAEYEDGFSRSVHLFEDINKKKGWEAGKEYIIETKGFYTELHITVSLPDENGKVLVRDFDFNFTQDIRDTWVPQAEIENQDDYFAALSAARKSDKTEKIVVDDLGSNEKIARAWMVAWFAMYRALPEDNMARITGGTIDSLQITKVSKPGLKKAFVFSVTCSIRPTYPIAKNSFWMAGNTGNSPGRDETWGQLYQEVALRIGDDGRYHFVEMGTGGVGNSNAYDYIEIPDPDYFIPQYTSNFYSDGNVVWKEDDLEIIAEKAASEIFNYNIIKAIRIINNDNQFEIPLNAAASEEEAMHISSLAFSKDKDYLALNIFYGYGNKVFIVNLNSGKHIVLNDYSEKFIETIHAYSWAPDSNRLAFAFGNTSQSEMAIYNLEHNFLLPIPLNNNYITTAYIYWHSDGKGIDFISEYPSDTYKLYRYSIDQDHTECVRDISHRELTNMPLPYLFLGSNN